MKQKINQFNKKEINILYYDVKYFLFKEKKFNLDKFKNFLEKESIEIIISCLMKKAIIEPDYEWK